MIDNLEFFAQCHSSHLLRYFGNQSKGIVFETTAVVESDNEYSMNIFHYTITYQAHPWEQRKFGDIGSVSMCKRIFKEETTSEGDIPFYKIGTFGSTPDAFISRELFEDYRARFSYPEEGAILLSASGTIGRIVEYKGEEAYFQDSNIVWLSHDKTVSNKFLKVLYPTVKWDGIEGSTIQRLYSDNFLKTRFMMPKLPEQVKLGEFFESVDNLITLHQGKHYRPEIGYLNMKFDPFSPYNTVTWEQRKLSSLCEKFTDGDWIESKDQSDFGVRLVQTGNVGVRSIRTI